ncbi:MAG: OadG family protein [Fervidobacterium sp.]|jgi:Na+-transporting methylmalonyl-CoA/oxaloacetate decarboxylase gamma subunit
MEGVNELSVTIVGITTVFIVFFILYYVFKIMEIVGISKNKKIKIPEGKSENLEKASRTNVESIENVEVQKTPKHTPFVLNQEDEEIAAVFAAIYSTLGENVIIKSITPTTSINSKVTSQKKGTRGWSEWRTYGWRGGNRW